MTDDELLAIANRVMDAEGNVCDSLLIFRALADYAYDKGAWDVVDMMWLCLSPVEREHLLERLHRRGIERPG